jgi:hypothetical protein
MTPDSAGRGHRKRPLKAIGAAGVMAAVLVSVYVAHTQSPGGTRARTALPLSAAPVVETWKSQSTPSPAGASDSELLGDSCVSPTDCMAVGFYLDPTDGNQFPIAESWNGKSWTATAAPPDPSGSPLTLLYSVSCVSSTFCMAVGQYDYNATGLPQTLAEEWNGSTWSIVTMPFQSGVDGNYMTGVSCTSATNCTAVGYFINFHKNILLLAEHWDGTTWTSQTITRPGQYSYLWGVSCTPTATGTSCVAVGNYQDAAGEDQPLAEAWDGTQWTIDLPPVPAGTNLDAYLDAVSCVSATDCEAIGYTNAQGTLAELWDGTSWTIQTTPNPAAGAAGSQLDSLSCTSATNCEAVGQYNVNVDTNADPATLAEAWDGTQWTLQTTPAATGTSYLRGVSCVPVTATAVYCDAVGHHYTGNAPPLTKAIKYVR